MKAIKNHAEIVGAHAAHKRDGAAMARFLAWFEREAPHGKLTEIDAVEALESFRRETGMLKDISFPTIAGSGPNGAIVHYRVTPQTDRGIAPNECYLIDFGGQFVDGTTDVTRTLWSGPGPAPARLKERATRVLQGHVALATARFPAGVAGPHLDALDTAVVGCRARL